MATSQQFDLIFLGGGNFTFQTINNLLHDGYRGRIAVVERRNSFVKNHRWCTWWPANAPLPRGTSAQWNAYFFRHQGNWQKRELNNWRYIHIESGQFYKTSLKDWEKSAQVEILWGESAEGSVHREENLQHVELSNRELIAPRVIDTRYRTDLTPSEAFSRKTGWWQSFYGQIIPGNHSPIDGGFGLMDFDLPEREGFAFGYILPLSENQTLFEYTAFHREAKSLNHMKAQLATYLGENISATSNPAQEEYGWLPMSSDLSRATDLPGLWQGGLRSNGARPATGYAYYRNRQRAQQISQAILRDQILPASPRQTSSDWLDPIFLETLVDQPALTKHSMLTLMKQLQGDEMAAFLTDQPSPLTLAKVLWTLPKIPFLAGVMSLAARDYSPTTGSRQSVPTRRKAQPNYS
ncbi:MAG: hypothetical protein LAT55_03250 [Opitutales bacterium]|nr:hypothetical protein [Opitutales bacterium]